MVAVVPILGPLVTAVGKIVDCFPIKDQFGYLFHYHTNIKKLIDETKALDITTSVVQVTVSTATRNLEIIRQDVQAWLNTVEEIKKEALLILQIAAEVEKGWCFSGSCLNVKARYSLSKKAMKIAITMVKLCAEGKFVSVSHPPPPVEIVVVSSTKFEGFESRLAKMMEIIEALKDDSISVIGICGMAGVGKTTILKEVLAVVKNEKIFDQIAFAEVTQAPVLERIQESIAVFLNLKLEENILQARASRLRSRLKWQRSLVVLDDIWRGINLEELGIPLAAAGCNGCKILLASRSDDACYEMGTERIFKIEIMPHEEALLLFRNIAQKSFYDPDLRQVAEDIVDECGGLPLAIVTMARMLKSKKHKVIWDDALQRLRSSNLEGEYAVIYSILELSYKSLESDELKHIFLLCCLFHEGHEILIEDLLRFGMGLRLFTGVNSVSEARTRALALIHRLRSLNLLESSHEHWVKVHDLVRDSGLKIASKDKHVFVVKHGDRLKFWPEEDTNEYCTSISLRCDEMSELPGGLRCPRLELLHLLGGNSHLKFPGNFYNGMDELKVLVLRGLLIQSNTVSFGVSSNIQTLCLDYCTFDKSCDLSSIGNLVKLKTLSFLHSDIRELPKEIGNLTELRLLDLTWCLELHQVTPGVFKSLILLEELYMRGTVRRWPTEQTKTCLRELNSLPLLSVLEIELLHYDLLPQEFVYQKLKSFRISVGIALDSRLFENTLIIDDATFQVDGGIQVLFNKAEILHLRGSSLEGRQSTIHSLNMSEEETFSKMRTLTLERCGGLVYIVDAMGRKPNNVFPFLESMNLRDLHHLKSIIGGQQLEQSFGEIMEHPVDARSMHSWMLQPQPPSFGNLHSLEIVSCSYLENVFFLSTAKALVKLESLKVMRCEMLKELFLKDGGDEDESPEVRIEFPEIKRLTLQDLPSLAGFSKAVDTVVLPQLLELRLHNIPKVAASNQHFFKQKFFATQLELLSISRMYLTEIQSDQFLSSCLTNVKSMILSNCYNLLTVVPSHLMQQLDNLKVLHLRECRAVKEVFHFDGQVSGVLNSLSELKLEYVPSMTHIWKYDQRNFDGFQNLLNLSLHDCHRLSYLFSPFVAKILVHLQTLSIVQCKMMEEIVKEEDAINTTVAENTVTRLVFPRLRNLQLIHLPSLRSFCSDLLDIEWPSLQSVKIKFCHQMMIFTNGKSTMPNITEIHIDNGMYGLEGDLNTTLRNALQKTRMKMKMEPEKHLMMSGEQNKEKKSTEVKKKEEKKMEGKKEEKKKEEKKDEEKKEDMFYQPYAVSKLWNEDMYYQPYAVSTLWNPYSETRRMVESEVERRMAEIDRKNQERDEEYHRKQKEMDAMMAMMRHKLEAAGVWFETGEASGKGKEKVFD